MGTICILACLSGSLLAANAGTTQATPAKTADQTIQAFIEATGGRSAWARIRTLYTREDKVGFDGVQWSVTTYHKRPNKIRYSEVFSDGSVNNNCYYDGQVAWTRKGIMDSPKIAEGDAATRIISRAQESFNTWLTWKADYAKGEGMGERVVRGLRTDMVRLTTRDGATEDYYFDKASHLLLMQDLPIAAADGKHQIERSFILDYRTVGGVQIPHLLVASVFPATAYPKGEDLPRHTTTLTEILINTEMPDSMFQKPNK